METSEWLPKRRNYDAEKKFFQLNREEATTHPLKSLTITVTEGKIKRFGNSLAEERSRSNSVSSDKSGSGSTHGGVSGSSGVPFNDPLKALLPEGLDPLSMLAVQSAAVEKSLPEKQTMHKDKPSGGCKGSLVVKEAEEQVDGEFEAWSMKRVGILSKYTTSEKLSITTSFLTAADKEKVVLKTQITSVSEKVKNRLELLEDFEEGSSQEILNLSQQEYVNRIDELNSLLIAAWDEDHRVKALKIAIQCAKLLADVSVIRFYPSKFVLITDILDTFGRLVYDRIKKKATIIPKGSSLPIPLPDNFKLSDVPESAKETCQNWFNKISSIRELIPRFYMEATILKCYKFTKNPAEYEEVLKRLAIMTRGIGDPLVAIYARCFLCRAGMAVVPNVRCHLMPCFDDFLTSYKQIKGDSVQNTLAKQRLELPAYLMLYSPALDWILQCLARKATDDIIAEVMDKSKQQCNSALLLNSVMLAFKPEFIAARAVHFTQLMKDCEETGFPKHLLYRSLGMRLVLSSPPPEDALNILNDVWKVLMKLKTPSDYISCAEVWIEYVVKNFSKKELNAVLGDIIKHMTPDRAYEDHYSQLQSIVAKILSYQHDFSVLFSMDKFLPFVDMFQKESVKVEVCKMITDFYVRYQTDLTNDAVIINAFMFICKMMHDSVTTLSLDDDIKMVGCLICGFIRTVSFGRDFEQQLSFYVEARASFSNIDSVLSLLIQSVNRLSMETRLILKGNHNRKTASFIRACSAYCLITIPSLNSIFSRLQLYLASGQVALANQCLPQADAFFKTAIALISDVPTTANEDGKTKSCDKFLLEYLLNFLSTLLVVPDNPEHEVFYLLRGLLNVVNEYTWDSQGQSKVNVYIGALSLISAASQEKYLHHIEKVDSNDALYGYNGKFLVEVSKLYGTLAEQVMEHIRGTLNKLEMSKKVGQVVVDFFNHVISHGDLRSAQQLHLAVTLWDLIRKHGLADVKWKIRMLDYIKKRSSSNNKEKQMYEELYYKLPLESTT